MIGSERPFELRHRQLSSLAVDGFVEFDSLKAMTTMKTI
jgi:hypothetical protein